MKIKEILMLFFGIGGLLIFMILVYKNYNQSQELKLIEKNIYYDSLLLIEYNELKEKDSIILLQQNVLRQIINNHGGQLLHIKGRIKKLEKEDTYETIL